MIDYVISLIDNRCKDVAQVGGKAANLHSLTAAGFNVPDGFCITSAAYRDYIAADEQMIRYFAELEWLSPQDVGVIKRVSEEICSYLRTRPLPALLVDAIEKKLDERNACVAYAVRSSSDSEDSADASFAGVHETYLNVLGLENIINAVRECWVSMFSERAINYRINKKFDHKATALAVVVQELVAAEASGIMFTSDPVNNDRDTICIDANFGLGESIVSGVANADHYRVQHGVICSKRVTAKHLAAHVDRAGGIEYVTIASENQQLQVLSDREIKRLAHLGTAIRSAFSAEQDIEWCWSAGKYYIVQSRPITTLFPVWHFPDQRQRILFSYSHWQMMTRPISPLGCSLWRIMFPIGKSSLRAESSYMVQLAGRLYIEISEVLSFGKMREVVPKVIGLLDTSMGSAVAAACSRKQFLNSAQVSYSSIKRWSAVVLPIVRKTLTSLFRSDAKVFLQSAASFRTAVADELINKIASETDDRRAVSLIQESAGRFEAIRLAHLVVIGVISSKAIVYLFKKWIGTEPDFDVLTKSVPCDISSEMGLAFGDLAEMVRENIEPDVEIKQDRIAAEIRKLVVGNYQFSCAINNFLEKHGMRCSGEADIACPRWRENVVIFAAPICNHIRCIEKNQHRSRFYEGELAAEKYIKQILEKVGATAFGKIKVRILAHFLAVYRNSFGLREYPKYLMMTLFDIYRKRLLDIGERLVKTDVIDERDDVFWLSLEELASVLDNDINLQQKKVISGRKAEYRNFERMQPPRVMTGSGEIINAPRIAGHEMASNVLSGTAVSAGVVVGRARIVTDPAEAQIEAGDVLIAPYTDPGWTPLFMSASALVTEIGGLMTHGTVVAREYGIPAVTCVENATTRIIDGQIVKVDGNLGYIEVMN